MRFRRGKRFQKLRELVRPPFTERMKRFKPQPHKPLWWAMVAGVVAVCGVVGWALT
jgi:hypothetical protein